MGQQQVLQALRDATVEPYQLGLTFRSGMIPPVAERCVPLTAGPLRFVVEARHLDDDAVADLADQAPPAEGEQLFDDYGPTLHIFGARDGIEHLRFDCFAHKPHYHYVREGGAVNIVCRLDQIAEGDPVEWTIGRLRERLPEMLDYCGVTELAEEARVQHDQIDAAVDDVAQLLRQARQRAQAERVAV
jgi:hypothetical protein